MNNILEKYKKGKLTSYNRVANVDYFLFLFGTRHLFVFYIECSVWIEESLFDSILFQCFVKWSITIVLLSQVKGLPLLLRKTI